MRQRLKMTRDTSIVAGLIPIVRVVNGISDPNTALYAVDRGGMKKNGFYSSITMDKLESTISVDSKPKTNRIHTSFHASISL
ncbi:hypothetical protein OSTOST_23908, partial [Ostertagia ostertagi]